MKRRIILTLSILAIVAGVAVAGVALAQDPEPLAGPSLDPTTMEAILVLVGGAIVTLITEGLKKLTKATGILAILETGFVAVATVGVYFLFFNPPFILAKFALYGVAIFGEATGFFHFYQKRATP